jgi:hypothetical protein
VVQHKLELAKAIGSLAIRWKLIPGDDTRLEEVMDTAMQEVLRRPSSVRKNRQGLGSKGLRGSQEHRWVTIGPERDKKWRTGYNISMQTLPASLPSN